MADKVTKGALAAASTPGKGIKVDSSVFDSTPGETYSGLNILKLEKGEAAGSFVLKEIKRKQLLGKPPKAPKKDTRKPVDVYIATHEGREVRMPIAAAFTMKAADANLSQGDTFLVRRSEDYTSEFGTVCKGYEIKVTERAKK